MGTAAEKPAIKEKLNGKKANAWENATTNSETRPLLINGLTEEQIKALKEKLEENIKNDREGVKSISDRALDCRQAALHSNDMNTLEESDTTLVVVQEFMTRNQLNREEAIKRIQRTMVQVHAAKNTQNPEETIKGLKIEYGRCVDCLGPIGFPRLSAVPEALFCMACSPKNGNCFH